MVDNNWTVKVKIWKGRFAKSCMYLPQPWPQEVTPASSGASPSPRGQTSGPPLSPATQVMSTVRLLPEHESLPSSPAHNMSSLIRKPYLGIVQTYSVQALVVRFLASFLLSNTHSSVHKVSPTTGRDTWYRKLWTNSCLLRQTGLPSQYFCYFGWVWQIQNEKQIQITIWWWLVHYYWEAPHSVEGSPAGVACNPRYAGVNGSKIDQPSTNDQPSPRQDGEAVVSPWFRQVWDEAGFRDRSREQLNVWKRAAIIASSHHLP